MSGKLKIRPLGVPLHPVTKEQVLAELERLDTIPLPKQHNCPAPRKVPLQGTPWRCKCGKRWLASKPGWRLDPKWRP